MPLAIFCGFAARFVSDLVGNPEDRLSHNEALMVLGNQSGHRTSNDLNRLHRLIYVCCSKGPKTFAPKKWFIICSLKFKPRIVVGGGGVGCVGPRKARRKV